jgi:hypothetical protein
MRISKQEHTRKTVRASVALFVFLSLCFSCTAFAQVPTGNPRSGNELTSDLKLRTSDLADNYASTDFTFELSDLGALGANDGSRHSISCQKVTDLDFGRAFSGISAGTVVMDPNTSISRKATGGVILDNRNIGHPAYLQLTITNPDHCENDDHCTNDNNECDRSEDDDNKTNDQSTTFNRHGVVNTISLPSSTTLSLTVGSHTYTMTADTYKFIRTNGNFYIGATLHVGANQVAGVYTGSFTVTQTCN